MFKGRIFGLMAALVLLFSGAAIAVEGMTGAVTYNPKRDAYEITLTITTHTDGSLVAKSTDDVTVDGKTLTEWMKWKYLYEVHAKPGTTAPDAADLIILDKDGMGLLGSPDGGTTAYGGKNLIHATLSKMTHPYFYNTNAATYDKHYHLITGALTLDVLNQATNSGIVIVRLIVIP